MTDSIGSATSNALSGLLRAQQQLNDAASKIASGFSVPGAGSQPTPVQDSDPTQAVVEALNAKVSFSANVASLDATDQVTRKILDITV